MAIANINIMANNENNRKKTKACAASAQLNVSMA